MDDMCAINDHMEFDKNYKDIFSSELELKKVMTFNLDLSVVLKNRILRLSYLKHSLFL